MIKHPLGNHCWSVLLAGGDGQRLLPLTRLVTGDDRPKQFCPLLPGGKTLLTETRVRTARFTTPKRTLFVLNKVHEEFYGKDLADVPADLMVVQPENRGTLPAILASLARIVRKDGEAIVGFFPTDHHYSQEDAFVEGVERGFQAARSRPNTVILMGAKATHAEPSYGYIEPLQTLRSVSKHAVQPVSRFWEKPSVLLAQSLREQGCLWNTFVMIGYASAFLQLIRDLAPHIYAAFEPFLNGPQQVNATGLARLYRLLPQSDFSKQVLARGCSSLSVLNIGETGWSDLGDPDRMIETLAARDVKSPWRELWTREKTLAALAS